VLEVIRPVRVIGRRKRDKGGYVLPPIAGLVIEKYISSSIQIVSLTVDTRLGRVQLEEAWAGFGVGRLITPELAVSQAKGGILQGLSYALYEERRLDPKDGFLLSAGLEDYRIMGIGDVPRIHVHFDERGYEKTRAQAVGLGELVTLAPAAAVGNAVFDATGWRPRDLPLRPDRVLQGVRG
jgi:xanthine dehydrogenase YagR molybdenum-binding subunit